MHSAQQPEPADGDIYRDRFERCFDEHYVRIFAFAMRRIRDRAAAEDVVADTFAVAWRRRDAIPSPALPWLYGVASNLIANEYRSSGRRQSLDLRLAGEASTYAEASDPAESLGGRDELATAFAALEEPDREALRLVAWEGLSTADAARVLGCSAGAFRVRLHRARRRLARELKNVGSRSHDTCRTSSRPAEEGS